MVMVTYDGLNVASETELQNRPFNSLEGSMSVVAMYCGSDRRWYYVYIHMRSSSGLFHVNINAKASIISRQVSVNLFGLGFGWNVKGNAVKMLLKKYSPATLSPTGCVAPNEGCITVIFFIYDGGGIKYCVWKMQILLFCQQQKSI